jgi:hypothetical protein
MCVCVGAASAGGPLHAAGQDCQLPIEPAVRDVEPTVLGCIAGKNNAAEPGRNAIMLSTFVFAMSAHQPGDRP